MRAVLPRHVPALNRIRTEITDAQNPDQTERKRLITKGLTLMKTTTNTRKPALSTIAKQRGAEIEEAAVALAARASEIGTSGQAMEIAKHDPLTAGYIAIRCFLSRLGSADTQTAHGLAWNLREYAADAYARRVKEPRFDIRPVRDVAGNMEKCHASEAECFGVYEIDGDGWRWISDCGTLDDAERIVLALSGPSADVPTAAAALLRRIMNMTTDDFAKGGEREEREQLAAALVAAGYVEFVP